MEKFEKNLTKYDKNKYYIVKRFNWNTVDCGEIIKMNIKDYQIGSDFLYFHVVDKTNDDIICVPKNRPTLFYSFHRTFFNNDDDILRRITESGVVEFKLQIMVKVSLVKWLFFKLNNLLSKFKRK
jgi:hypothetical protein